MRGLHPTELGSGVTACRQSSRECSRFDMREVSRHLFQRFTYLAANDPRIIRNSTYKLWSGPRLHQHHLLSYQSLQRCTHNRRTIAAVSANTSSHVITDPNPWLRVRSQLSGLMVALDEDITSNVEPSQVLQVQWYGDDETGGVL